ncbi:DUF4115 domain-containing protein [Puniceicoccales bacterium CK1056]|uniref:DUF4115 domain-containing protein n=1 Tax=Oceanipulchritudo coccoides TaxID=2706888 RepID=A0A6B2M1R6_9BACT|nr:helix-turn-helix domain-containing protein [Oceanipulchritudo coccoides]NDV62951.1 DUF4115 domain-containing protein [Oceanipulchritudo coccoides]
MIGERLEEARKRKGVSVREAAEATKIRGDFLLAMEDNSFEIDLPQIYVRGFLKNYARFLKLDPVKILTDYDAHQLGRTQQEAHNLRVANEKESLGHVELKLEDEPSDGPQHPANERVVVTEAPEEDGPEPELHFSLDKDRGTGGTVQSPPPPTLEREGTRHDQESWNENKTLYMKIGIVFSGILLVSIILIVLIQLLKGDDTPEINPDLAPTQTTSLPATPTSTVTSGQDTIIVTASDNVTLIVEQTIDRKRLYSGSLNAGETLSLDKEGPVSIRFTNGSAVTIEKNGQQFRPGQPGVGRTVVE